MEDVTVSKPTSIFNRKKGAIKSRLTKFKTYLDSLEIPLSENVEHQLRLRIDKISTLQDEFNQIISEQECAEADDAVVQKLYEERDDFDDEFYEAVARAKSMLSRASSVCDDDHASFQSLHHSGHNQVGSTRNFNVKLPTISLPKFNGAYEQWLEFRDTFTSLIHENQTIDDVSKFHYLRCSLEGSAAQVIQSINLSKANYSTAWQLLQERYNNTQSLIQNHVKSLFNIKPMCNESSKEIRTIIDTFNTNLRALTTLGENTSQWDTLLLYLVSSKLDASTSKEWEQAKMSITKPTYDEIMSFMKKRAILLETLEGTQHGEIKQVNITNSSNKSSMSKTGNNIHNVNKRNEFEERHQSYAIAKSNTTLKAPSPPVCPLCEQGHRLYFCNDFRALTIVMRTNKAKELKVCLNCLRPNHTATECTRSHCQKCTIKHNTLLHTDIDTQTASSSDNVALSVSTQASCKRVLLATALVSVYDVDGKPQLEHCLTAGVPRVLLQKT
ncbi:hypothetical protein ABMA27_004421 [Loxostege sticticalis]|uniref:Uncharacterized protein n=1 Tax=Loxostege sticticalis TaxID=481309 RepID=A0ABR3HNJ7_LOXSC